MSNSIKKIGRLKLEDAEKNFLRSYPDLIADIAEDSLNHFLEGFRKGGGQTNESRNGWPERKEPDAGRALLVKTGHLRNDLKVLEISPDKIIIGVTRIPYAQIHNEGGIIEVIKPKTTKALRFKVGEKTVFTKQSLNVVIPQREFIGESDELNEKNRQTIIKTMDKILKK